MKNLSKQMIITGEQFTIQQNVVELNISEEKYVASIVYQTAVINDRFVVKNYLAINGLWWVDLGEFTNLNQISISYQGQKTVLARGENGLFPQFQVDKRGEYTPHYAAAQLLAA